MFLIQINCLKYSGFLWYKCHEMTVIASIFAVIHRNKFFKKYLNRCFHSGHFLKFFHWKKAKTLANKIIAGIRKISEFPKFKNRVKIRILPANARKNIFYFLSRSERLTWILWLLWSLINSFSKNFKIYKKCNLAPIPPSAQ